MKKHNIILFFIIVSIALSCNQLNDKRKEIRSFPESILLSGETIEDIHLQEVRTIRIIDSIIVILNKKGDYFFEYYNCNDYKLLGKYGKKGKGPGEFIDPNLIGEFYRKVGKRTILNIYDWKRRRMSYIDINESIHNSSYICKSDRIKNNLVNISDIILDNDSTIIIIPDLDGTSRFEIYNKLQNTIKHVPFIPQIVNGGVHRNNQYYLYATSGNCVCPKKQFFIAAPNGNGQLDFFDFYGNYLKTIHLRDNEQLKEFKSGRDVQTINGLNIFYSDLQIDNDEVYALFTVVKTPDLRAIDKSKVFVFDLDGNPKREYILNKEIHRFAIDSVNKRFLGFSTEGLDGYQLYAFNFE